MPPQGVQNSAEAEAHQERQDETSTGNDMVTGEAEGVQNPAASSGDVSGEGVQNPAEPAEDTSTPMEEDHTGEETAQGRARTSARIDDISTRSDPYHMDEFYVAIMSIGEEVAAIRACLMNEPDEKEILNFDHLPRAILSIEALESEMRKPPSDHELNETRAYQVHRMREIVQYKLGLHKFGQAPKNSSVQGG